VKHKEDHKAGLASHSHVVYIPAGTRVTVMEKIGEVARVRLTGKEPGTDLQRYSTVLIAAPRGVWIYWPDR